MRILPSLLSVSLVFGYPVWALEPINIGICVPLSGHEADRGHKVLLGIKIAHRIRPQVFGRPVALKVANTNSEPAGTAMAVFSLVARERVEAIIHGLTCDYTIPGSCYAEERGIAVVAPLFSHVHVGHRKQCVSQTGAVDADQACLAAKIARSCVKAQTVGIVCDISRESSVRMAACFKREFMQRGGTITVETRVKAGDRDFTAQIHRIVSARPDAIYAPISCTECALLARQARLAGMNIPMLAAHHVHAAELIALGGKSVENLVFTSHVQECSNRFSGGEKFSAACQFYTGERPVPELVMAADAYVMLLDAIERAGEATSIKIREALASARGGKGMTEPTRLGTHANASARVFVSQVKGGQFVPYEESVGLNP